MTIWGTKAPEFQIQSGNQATFARNVPKWSPAEKHLDWKWTIGDWQGEMTYCQMGNYNYLRNVCLMSAIPEYPISIVAET